MRVSSRYILFLLLFLLALFVRTDGLFQGLPEGVIYHPDTPKQVAAVQRFMDGRFYEEVGSRDYDGYPFFNSLIAAGVAQPVLWLQEVLYEHMNPGESYEKDEFFFYRLLRVQNAIFSALAVGLLFWLGTSMCGRCCGVVAGMLFIFSPVDISACHFANGDSTAAFFGLLSVCFAWQVYRKGQLRYYVGAAAACVLSFSAKYHGAVTVSALVYAHLIRNPSFYGFFGRKSLQSIGLSAVTAMGCFALSNPGFFSHPVITVENIVQFMKYTSGFKLDEAYASLSVVGRFIYSMQCNLPVIAALCSPVLMFGALGLLIMAVVRRDCSYGFLLCVPVVYMVVGLAAKPAVQTVYHTMVTPYIILSGTIFYFQLIHWRVAWRIPAVVGGVALVGAACWMVNASLVELLLFRIEDTRLLARQWMADNVPMNFRQSGSKYSFMSDTVEQRPGPFEGVAWMRSDFREPVELGDPMIYSIKMEEPRVAAFRHFETEVYLAATPLLTLPVSMPVFLPVESPGRTDNQVLLADEFNFYRTPRVMRLKQQIAHTILSTNSVLDVVGVLRGGRHHNKVKVQLSDAVWEVFLPAGEVRVFQLGPVNSGVPHMNRLHAYAFSVEAATGDGELELAFTDEQKAVALFNVACYTESQQWFSRLESRNNETLEKMRRIVSQRCGNEMPPFSHGTVSNDVPLSFGVSPDYLNRLPYINLLTRNWNGARGVYLDAERDHLLITTTTDAAEISTADIYLRPGVYCGKIRIDMASDSSVPGVAGIDAQGNMLPVVAKGDEEYLFYVSNAASRGPLRFVVYLPKNIRAEVQCFSLRPDVTETVKSLVKLIE